MARKAHGPTESCLTSVALSTNQRAANKAQCFKMEAVAKKFEVSLYDYQKSVFDQLMKGKDVFVCQRTGRGKSLCYLGYTTLQEGGMVLVLSPLNAIIHEQVSFLEQHGIAAGVLGTSKLSDVIDGKFQYIFTSPETLLGKQEHRDMLRTPSFQERLRLIAIDEAHVVVMW
jgi:ATP-dependent DNA helicase RecQ